MNLQMTVFFGLPTIIESTSKFGYIFNIDFSENISCKPKYEPQDAHFSGKQTSLHCTVSYLPTNDHHYHYHISNNLGHESAYTINVLHDLLEEYPAALEYPLIRIKTENCKVQYKCRYVFAAYSKLSKDINLPIIAYYGVPGHGRGLVDAMSGFGLKDPLRRAIITDDFFFNNAEELHQFLEERFREDPSKFYTIISSDVLAKSRENKSELMIKGCMNCHMISFHPNGEYFIKEQLCFCSSCQLGKFKECEEVVKDDETVQNTDVLIFSDNDKDNGLNFLDDDGDNFGKEAFLMIEAGSLVALYSAENSLENFILCRIDSKSTAESDIEDSYGHVIRKGMQYLSGVYYEKEYVKKHYVHYKVLEKLVLINPAQVFYPFVQFENHKMSMMEYQNICDCAA